MPYAIRFVKPFTSPGLEHHVNERCIAADIVLERLLPCLTDCYCNVRSRIEGWGSFAWFEESGVKLAIDIFGNDDNAGMFRIELSSRKPRFLLPAKITDTPELESLRKLVVTNLESWNVVDLVVERVK